MAILDFIKNRPQQQSVAQTTQAPESPSVQALSPEVKSQAVEAARPAAALMEKATQHRSESPAINSDHEGGKEALRHNQSGPSKSQEAMSPTDNQKGHTEAQERSQSHGRSMER